MTWYHITYFISIIITAVVMGFIAWYSRKNRNTVVVAGVSMWVALLLSLLSIFQGISMIGPTEEWARFWFNMRIGCFASIPVLWLVFVLRYIGKQGLLSKPRIALLFVIPVVTQVMLWTNDWHGLWVVRDVGFHHAGLFFIPDTAVRVLGLWHKVHNLYTYGIMLAGIVILFAMSARLYRQYRGQVVTLGTGTLVMIIGSLFPILNLIPGMELNPLPLSFALGSLIIACGLYRHRFLGATPLFDREKSVPTRLIALFVLMTAGILITGFVYYSQYREHHRIEIERQLSAISELKLDELVQWRKERISDAVAVYNNPIFSGLVNRLFSNPADVDAQWLLRTWLDTLKSSHQYDQILLLDAYGSLRMSAPQNTGPVCGYILRQLSEIKRTGKITFLDFHREAPDKPIHLSVVVPIIDGKNGYNPSGYLVMLIDPAFYLYPMISRWPTPSRTAETLLVRRDGNDAQFLNELRFMKNTALNLRIPLPKKETPAVMAVLGQEGMVEGIDYRGVQVFAALRTVPDSPWSLVAHMDLSEVYAPVWERFWVMVIVVLGLLAGTGAGIWTLWRRQEDHFTRERLETAEALHESEEIFRQFMEHSPIYVFFKNLQIRTLRLSKNYEAMLGKPIGELLGKTMDELFPSDFAKNMIADDLRVLKEGKQIEIEEELNGRIYTTIKFPILQDGKPRYLAGFTIDITKSKRAEESLKRERDFAESIIETAQTIILILDSQGRIIRLNQYMEKISGYTTAEVQGKDWFSTFLPKCDREGIHRLFNNAIDGIKTNGIVNPIVTKDGRVRVIEWFNKTLKDTQGNVIGLLSIGQDITVRKQAEESLRQSLDRLHNAYKLANIGAWDWKADTDTVTWTEELYRIAGRDPMLPAPTYAEHPTIYTPESWEVLKTAVERAMETCEPYQLELELIRPDGNTRYVNAYGSVQYDTNGQVNGLYGIVQDITERKRAEEELKKSNQLLIDTGEMAQVGGWELDLSTREVLWTEETCRIHGVEPGYKPKLEEAIKFYAPESIPALEATLKNTLETGEPYDLESLFIPKGSNEKIWVRSLGRAVYSGGKIVKLTGTFQNIDKYKKAEEALWRSEEKYRGIIENINDVIFTMDIAGLFTYLSPVAEKIIGYTQEEMIGQPFTRFVYQDDLPMLMERFRTLLAGEIKTADYRIVTKSGDVRWVRSSSQPLIRDGKAVGIQGVITDITERKKANLEIQDLTRHLITIQEEERQRVARDLHDSVGQTVLAAKLSIEAYLNNKSDRKRLGKGLAFLDRASQELRGIYTGLYPSILEDLGLEAAVRWYAKHLLEANGISASLDIALEAEIDHDTAVNLYRIIQEILSNVMKHSGADSVELEIREKGGVITVTVQDKGIGFDEKDLGVDRFGLSNLRYRASLLGGECRIDSKDGEGTIITVTAMRTEK